MSDYATKTTTSQINDKCKKSWHVEQSVKLNMVWGKGEPIDFEKHKLETIFASNKMWIINF